MNLELAKETVIESNPYIGYDCFYSVFPRLDLDCVDAMRVVSGLKLDTSRIHNFSRGISCR